MRLIAKLLWFLAFIAATIAWMILFEYCFTVEAFGRGLRQEWNALTSPAAAAPAANSPIPPTPNKP